MKFNVTVECTPEEARRFVGLPDVSPFNEKLVEEMTKRMEANVAMMGGGEIMKNWMAVGTQAQDAFLKLMSTGASAALKATDKS